VFFALYVLFFAGLLVHIRHGVGQYWDWVFPYYSDQIGNYFSRASLAWTNDTMGSPLGYASDFFLRFVVGLFQHLRPEFLLYALMIMIFASGAFGVFIIARRHVNKVLAFLLGVVAFVNPAIFYNFTAGYVDYLVAYTLFIYLVYFLLYKFKPDLKSAIIVGLFIAFIGVQIQLFVVAGLLVALFFIFHPIEWRWKYTLVMFSLPVLISLVWLSNFLFGGSSLSAVSDTAAKGGFKGLSGTDYLNIFNFSFSKATLISRFYNWFELTLNVLLFALVIISVVRAKLKRDSDVFLLVFMLVMVFLSTGLFMAIDLGPLTMLYPMFREVGHFAPIMVLALVLLLGRLMPRGAMGWLCLGLLAVSIIITFAKFQSSPQAINFASVRQQFAEFKNFGDRHPDANHRVLAYPFFDQYTFTKFGMNFQDNLPMRNSGHDSFSAYSNEQFVKNAVKPQDFKNSVQYKLLQAYDVELLRPYNVQYIYDFSDKYESYYERYVPPTTYDNDLSLIKNDHDFLNKLLAANPGKLTRVSDHILAVTNPTPRVAAQDVVYSVNSPQEGGQAQQFAKQNFPDKPFNYVSTQDSQAPPGSTHLSPLFTNTDDPKLINTNDKALEQAIQLPGNDYKSVIYANTARSELTYSAHNGELVFSVASAGKLYANDTLVQDNGDKSAYDVAKVAMVKGERYFVSLNDSIVPIPAEGQGKIGHLNGQSTMQLYTTAGRNLIDNPSLESGLWDDKVGDCNNYDRNADIHMSLTNEASDGQRALELQAKRHDACTSTNTPLRGDTSYLLSYDYQSPSAQTASFYLRFNNSDTGAIKRFQSIADSDWHTTAQLITSPSNANSGQLFVHAIASDRQDATINHYDNFSLLELRKLGDVNVSPATPTYSQFPVPSNVGTSFRFVDDAYDYQNVVQNGSFEQGAWQDKVTDCNNYDKSGSVGMSINSSAKTDGKQSLQLEATRHVACTYTNANVTPGTDYVLSYDYQGENAQQVGYYAEFDDPNASGRQEDVPISDRSWHTYTTTIHIPAQTSSLRLFLHAYESNGTTKNIVHLDNVKLVAVPPVEGRFYVVSTPNTMLQKPQKVEFTTVSTAKKAVRVIGARAPFMLSMSESYHPAWRLELNTPQVTGPFNTWLPTARANAVAAKDHLKLDDYANGWYIDPAQLCAANSPACRRQANGLYDIQLIAEFVPERWFVVNRALSVAVVVLGVGYVSWDMFRHRHVREGYWRWR